MGPSEPVQYREVLGRGGYGTVYKAFNKATCELVRVLFRALLLFQLPYPRKKLTQSGCKHNVTLQLAVKEVELDKYLDEKALKVGRPNVMMLLMAL